MIYADGFYSVAAKKMEKGASLHFVMTLEQFIHLKLNMAEMCVKVFSRDIYAHPVEQILSPEEYCDFLCQLVQMDEREVLNKYPELSCYEEEKDLYRYYRKQHHRFIQILENDSSSAQRNLLHHFENQTEDEFITNDWDIDTSRMLRYFPGHWHANTYFEIYYCFQGQADICFKEDAFVLKARDACIVAPGVVHAEIVNHEETIVTSTAVRASTFQSTFMRTVSENKVMASFFRRALSGQTGNEYIYFDCHEDEKLTQLFFELYQEYQGHETYQKSMLNCMMSGIFLRLLRCHEKDMILPAGSKFCWKSEYGELFAYIENHFQTVTMEELSDLFHYSQRQIIRIVRSCTGQKFAQLVRQMKLQSAVAYLRGTELSVDAIGEKVGYNNPGSFCRAFHEEYGMSPSEYRSRQKEMNKTSLKERGQ